MTNRTSIRLPIFRQNYYFFILTTLLIFSCTLIIKAQSEFSKNRLPFFNRQNAIPDEMNYRSLSGNFSMPTILNQNHPLLADDDIDSTFNASVTEGSGYVKETVMQPDGKIIVVGYFQRVNGTRASNLTRLNADGTLDTSFNTGTGISETDIEAVALQTDGKILIGGGFSTFNGQTVNRIARLLMRVRSLFIRSKIFWY
jgi:hypothetical protein